MTVESFNIIILGAGINDCGNAKGYKLDLHKINGTKLLHVFGGKLITFLSMA